MKDGNKKTKVYLRTPQKVVVAMSGGVDSSVAATLLNRQGFDVVGVFMKFWKDPSASSGPTGDNRCCSIESESLARAVAKKLKIPFYVINVEKEFKKEVVDYFLNEYKKGNTPNPCVVCNKEIKFGILIEKAMKLGANLVATGHYARIKNDKLLKGIDKSKDQSYFLWRLEPKQLKRILFPVGGYKKTAIRKLAKKFKLPTAETPESQEVCFISTSTGEFIEKYLTIKPGDIVDATGKRIGDHNGLWFYTIGQRHGLKVFQGPYYVISKDFKKNNLVVSKNKKDLLRKEFIVRDVNWLSAGNLPIRADVKIRYKSDFAKAKIVNDGKNKVKIFFLKPQIAITPGQSAVFYKGEQLLGGGIIVN